MGSIFLAIQRSNYSLGCQGIDPTPMLQELDTFEDDCRNEWPAVSMDRGYGRNTLPAAPSTLVSVVSTTSSNNLCFGSMINQKSSLIYRELVVWRNPSVDNPLLHSIEPVFDRHWLTAWARSLVSEKVEMSLYIFIFNKRPCRHLLANLIRHVVAMTTMRTSHFGYIRPCKCRPDRM